MALVVIGGNSRNIGKTSVACALISALGHLRWTAIKISQCAHHLCSADGAPCNCETSSHTFALTEEQTPDALTDSSRFLAAGAHRAVWIRIRPGHLAEAMPHIHAEIARSENVLFESNSILEFLDPHFYASVLHPHVADFKPSARRYLSRANALLLPDNAASRSSREADLLQDFPHIPVFRIAPPVYAPQAFVDLVARSLAP